MLYFSYGSNMSVKRLGARVPSAIFVTLATLGGYTLEFHKIGKDLSAKCDAFDTGIALDKIVGVVYELPMVEKLQLDRFEGLDHGYTEKEVVLTTAEGCVLTATTYIATEINRSLQPFHWYKEHVLTGAKENGLPPEYIEAIDAVASVGDPDRDRHTLEMSIYS